MIEVKPFCTQWSQYVMQPRAALLAYVASEVRRVANAGEPVLTTILRSGNDDVVATAMQMVSTNSDGTSSSGTRLLAPRLWRLRLVEGAVPPDLDPQGRPIDKDRRGKVLIAKVGNLGGEHTAQGGIPDKEWTGPRRSQRAASRQDIYRLAEVTSEPTAFDLGDAVTILRQWGYGITSKQYRRPKHGSGAENGQCLWLVEEYVEPRPSAGQQAPKSRAA